VRKVIGVTENTHSILECSVSVAKLVVDRTNAPMVYILNLLREVRNARSPPPPHICDLSLR